MITKFNICPRCSNKYWWKRFKCKKCSFSIINDAWEYPDQGYYMFETDRYIVSIYDIDNGNVSLIKDKMGPLWTSYTIKKAIDPKATDETIEKLLILL